MTKTYIVYDTHNNGVVYAYGTAKKLARIFDKTIGSIYEGVSNNRLIKNRFEIMKIKES